MDNVTTSRENRSNSKVWLSLILSYITYDQKFQVASKFTQRVYFLSFSIFAYHTTYKL